MLPNKSMNVIVLGAGHGTRLERDLRSNDEFAHLLGVPKLLLPIGGTTLLSRWMALFESSGGHFGGVYVGVR